MKRWRSYLLALLAVAAVSWGPFSGSDVAKLEPVEVLRLSREDGVVVLETDTQNEGRGTDVQNALVDMKRTASAEIFLDTADYLVIAPDCADLLAEVTDLLRPATQVCVQQGDFKLEEAAGFFAIHDPDCTLQDIRVGTAHIPVLRSEDGRMELVR